MKTKFLFPHQFKKIGWLLFVTGIILIIVINLSPFDFNDFFNIKVLAIYQQEYFQKDGFFKIIENDVLDEIILSLLIIGGILVGFSKLKTEDELIAKIRYESLVWASYFNFAIVLLATLFMYGMAYFDLMITNLFSMLLFFIIRFHYLLYKLQKSMPDEE
jgi:hypothetical protein